MDQSYWAIEWYITQHFILQSMFKFYTIQPVAYEYKFLFYGQQILLFSFWSWFVTSYPKGKTYISKYIFFGSFIQSFLMYSNQWLCYYPRWPNLQEIEISAAIPELELHLWVTPPPFLPPLKRGIKRTLFNESFVFIWLLKQLLV